MANQKVAARLQVGPNCLLFFIDETGHETFADKNYPVFGLGGCAINGSSAAAVIAEPWRAMKAAHFGGPCGDDVEIGCAADWQDAVRNHHLCLSEIKSGHIRDAIRRGPGGTEYVLPSLRCAIGAHPCPRPSACASHYSSERKISESGADVPRLRQ